VKEDSHVFLIGGASVRSLIKGGHNKKTLHHLSERKIKESVQRTQEVQFPRENIPQETVNLGVNSKKIGRRGPERIKEEGEEV